VTWDETSSMPSDEMLATQEGDMWQAGADIANQGTDAVTTDTTTWDVQAELDAVTWTDTAVDELNKEVDKTDESTTWEDESISSILDELEKLWASQDEQQKREEAVTETTEKIKEAEQKGEDTSELISQLQQEVIELRSERKKSSITTDFLQEQVEQLHKENLQYKYGRVDEDWVMNLINTDPNLKSIISQTIKSQDTPEAKTKLVDLYKSQLEKLTWLNFTDFIESQNSKAEWEMVAWGNDVADNVNVDMNWESLFI